MFIAEYIWLDSENKFRSKTKVCKEITSWNFDGSSTGQSEVKKSELILNPVFKCPNPFRYVSGFDCVLILCDVWEDDHTPHFTNSRAANIDLFEYFKNEKPMFGFEQEFFLKLPKDNENHYCKTNTHEERMCIDDILNSCLRANLSITGMNAEVASHQWEIQVCDYGIGAVDQLIILRYIIEFISIKYNFKFILHPKPSKTCNGSGCHINFSTEKIRNCEWNTEEVMDKFKKTHKKHIDVYGDKNELRLTGTNETCDINCFKWGYKDRTASIRCNHTYFEDRRPSSNVDPYIACAKILDTLYS